MSYVFYCSDCTMHSQALSSLHHSTVINAVHVEFNAKVNNVLLLALTLPVWVMQCFESKMVNDWQTCCCCSTVEGEGNPVLFPLSQQVCVFPAGEGNSVLFPLSQQVCVS